MLKHREYLIVSPLSIESNQLKKHKIDDSTTNIKINNSLDNKKDLLLNLQQISNDENHIPDIKNTSPNIVIIDKDLLKFPLTVRKWDNGDYFYPFGLQGRKKLSKYFKDEKMSLLEKENIWLLCSKNEIVWVIGKRLDDRYKITNKTKKILKITLKA